MSLLIVATAFAGCTGDDGSGDPDPDDGSTAGLQPEDTNTTAPTTNTTTTDNATADANATAQASWRYDNRSGEAPGTMLPIQEADASEETLAVDEAAAALRIEVDVTGDDAVVRLAPPGCDEESCMMTSNASEGTAATFDVDSPDSGQWLVEIEAEPGLLSDGCAYELVFAQLIAPAANTTEMTTATNTTSPP
jgi:hypothetical protein